MIEELDKKTQVALQQLTGMLGGNSAKVRKMIHVFIDESTENAKLLGLSLLSQDWLAAASLLHKIIPRYGYIGLDEVAANLRNWENQLRNPRGYDQKEALEEFEKFQTITAKVVETLKASEFFQDKASQASEILKGKVVLVAEDDEVNAMVFELFVKELGGHVIKAKDGNEAVKLSLEKKPDLIFMDIHMPFFSGLDAIKELRSKNVACPIVSLSASTRLNEKQNSLDLGANDFVIKPASRESINKLLLKYLL